MELIATLIVVYLIAGIIYKVAAYFWNAHEHLAQAKQRFEESDLALDLKIDKEQARFAKHQTEWERVYGGPAAAERRKELESLRTKALRTADALDYKAWDLERNAGANPSPEFLAEIDGLRQKAARIQKACAGGEKMLLEWLAEEGIGEKQQSV